MNKICGQKNLADNAARCLTCADVEPHFGDKCHKNVFVATLVAKTGIGVDHLLSFIETPTMDFENKLRDLWILSRELLHDSKYLHSISHYFGNAVYTALSPKYCLHDDAEQFKGQLIHMYSHTTDGGLGEDKMLDISKGAIHFSVLVDVLDSILSGKYSDLDAFLAELSIHIEANPFSIFKSTDWIEEIHSKHLK